MRILTLICCFVLVLQSCITRSYLDDREDSNRYTELKHVHDFGTDETGQLVVNFRAALTSKKEKDYFLRLPLYDIAESFDADTVQFFYPKGKFSDVNKVYILSANDLDEQGRLTLELKKNAIQIGQATIHDSWSADFDIFNRTGNTSYVYDYKDFSTGNPITLEIIAKKQKPDTYNNVVLSVDSFKWKNYSHLAVLPFTILADAVLFVGEVALCAALNLDCF